MASAKGGVRQSSPQQRQRQHAGDNPAGGHGDGRGASAASGYKGSATEDGWQGSQSSTSGGQKLDWGPQAVGAPGAQATGALKAVQEEVERLIYEVKGKADGVVVQGKVDRDEFRQLREHVRSKADHTTMDEKVDWDDMRQVHEELKAKVNRRAFLLIVAGIAVAMLILAVILYSSIPSTGNGKDFEGTIAEMQKQLAKLQQKVDVC